MDKLTVMPKIGDIFYKIMRLDGKMYAVLNNQELADNIERQSEGKIEKVTIDESTGSLSISSKGVNPSVIVSKSYSRCESEFRLTAETFDPTRVRTGKNGETTTITTRRNDETAELCISNIEITDGTQKVVGEQKVFLSGTEEGIPTIVAISSNKKGVNTFGRLGCYVATHGNGKSLMAFHSALGDGQYVIYRVTNKNNMGKRERLASAIHGFISKKVRRPHELVMDNSIITSSIKEADQYDSAYLDRTRGDSPSRFDFKPATRKEKEHTMTRIKNLQTTADNTLLTISAIIENSNTALERIGLTSNTAPPPGNKLFSLRGPRQ